MVRTANNSIIIQESKIRNNIKQYFFFEKSVLQFSLKGLLILQTRLDTKCKAGRRHIV